MNSKFISPEDMGIAYRKAKVDVYYSGHYSAEEIIAYENNLVTNLLNLREKISDKNRTFIHDANFLGSWHFIPKKIKNESPKSNSVIFTNPQEQWESISGGSKAEFRIIADVSWDFHVLAELWVLKVGHLFDEKLYPCAYGNRLRRLQDNKINPFSLGSFQPYLKPYRDWKNNALAAIQNALDIGKKVIAITGDISAFYHSLNPDFLSSPDFLNKIGVELNPDQKTLNDLFISALTEWQKTLPEGKLKGLPVGVPASSLIANVALFEFDKIVSNDITPIHFGRYVDDIILVLDNTANITSKKEIWERICLPFNGILEYQDDAVKFVPCYLENSSIQFKNEKNKIFVLNEQSGKNYIRSIQRQISERSSEWRAMPYLPESENIIAAEIAYVIEECGEQAENLRSSDCLTIRRSRFAMKLRDIESFERDLEPNMWKQVRHAFLRTIIENLLELPSFFEFSQYLPRIIRLVTVCEDFDFLTVIIKKIKRLKASVREIYHENDIYKWEAYLDRQIEESIISAFPLQLSKQGKLRWEQFVSNNSLFTFKDQSLQTSIISWPISSLQKKSKEYFLHDLGMEPFRASFLPLAHGKFKISSKDCSANSLDVNDILPKVVINGLELIPVKHEKSGYLPYALAFATRPLNLIELYCLYPDIYNPNNIKAIDELTLALRGFKPATKMPYFTDGILRVGDDNNKPGNICISTACWKTELSSWIASVSKDSDPDASRYCRLCKLIDDAMKIYPRPSYFIMPELSIPSNWFMRAALKLKGQGISFIAGVEYSHKKNHKITNQVWASLVHDSLGFPSAALYTQDKQIPALHEKHEVKRISGRDFSPNKSWKNPPIIQHGNLFFSILVCSELTNIEYRAFLRGKIDLLFVPAWNQDAETFNSLIESAALDIHAYIVECNDRAHGDTRIRAPYKDSWRRDITRLKGGNNDYLVSATVDIETLRRFQSGVDSPSTPFKPLPDGFKIAFARKMLPLEDAK